jgi:formamidopyrimidine-DNA glycosylase
MPELPEVELARRALSDWTCNRSIRSVESHDSLTVTGDLHALEGGHFTRWERRGKNLLGYSSGATGLLSHLGMTGKWVADAGPERPHQRLVITFEDDDALPHRVSWVDARRFGRAEFILNGELTEHPRVLGLGLEALSQAFDGAYLCAQLGHSKAPWKQKLLAQDVVAGLGNIAVCEIGWRSRIHPHKRCNVLSRSQWDSLAGATHAHLHYVMRAEEGPEIAYLGEKNAENPFLCYGRAGEPCPNCNALFVRVVLSGRPTFFCPGCQPL